MFFLASLAYMDVGQGRKQDAEALRLGERKLISFMPRQSEIWSH
jgi:hypothetical protein